MSLVKHDAGLSRLLNCSAVERIASRHQFTQGPVWHPDGYLLYSDVPADRIYFWSDEGVKTYRCPSGNSVGLVLDQQLRLIACEHGNRRVSRTELDGARIGIAERFEGKRLNSPSDAIVRSDGSIYFTDPPYGCPEEQRKLDFQGVYRMAPDGGLSLVIESIERPNGLAFSPDEAVLYVNDGAGRVVRAFDVREHGSVTSGRLLAHIETDAAESPGGMVVDAEGRLYVTGPEGIWVFEPDGRQIGILLTPEDPSNCCWGEMDRRTLFITACSSVYRVHMKVPGAGWEPAME